MTDLHSRQYASSWENFWQKNTNSNPKNPTMPCFGGQARNLQLNWERLLQPYTEKACRNNIVIDIAAGDGVVTYSLLQLLKQQVEAAELPQLYCTDYSLSACVDAMSRDSQMTSVCTKTEQLPFADETADLILSQFGIEYSGSAGFAEAWRVLNSQGRFIAICHFKGGTIYNECRTHFDASRAFYQSGIFKTAEKVFRQANLVLEGRASQNTFVEADREFSVSVSACKQVFAQYGKSVCANYLYKIFAELGQMFNSIQSYQLSDVLLWLGDNNKALVAYSDRMESMTKSALSEAELEQIFHGLKSQAKERQIHWKYQPLMPQLADETLSRESALPIAWIVEMSKS